jgi:hypothetical protein
MTYAIAIIGLILVAAIFGWALYRKHPEDFEREASDRAAEDRASSDGFAQRIDLGEWGDIVKPLRRRSMEYRPVQKLPEHTEE